MSALDDLDGIFRRLDNELRNAQPFELPEAHGEGTSEGDEVHVRVGAGAVESVHIDVRAMRLTNADLGDHVRDAVNAALRDYAEQLASAMEGDAPDLATTRGHLEGIRAETNAALGRYLDQMGDMLAQASRQHAAPTASNDDRRDA